MQQGAAGGGASGQQYGVPPDVAQFAGGSGRPPHGHMLGISHDQTAQHLQQHQQLLQQSSHKVESLNEISQPPPPPPPPTAQRSAASFEQLMPNNGGGFGEEEGLPPEDGERGGPVGNRWPRQETLALLKIRSEMDATFRDASLKGPLWEDVSRRLAELGYNRSAKKCKEKFENVHKYYKRTKDGRAGRQDGKSYRFFSQLEALQSSNGNNNNGSPTSNANDARNIHNNTQTMSSGPGPGPGPTRLITQPCSAPAMLSTSVAAGELNRSIISAAATTTTNPAVIRHSSDFSGGNLSFSSDSSEEDDDYDEQTDSRKRKRASSGSTASTKDMMLFFEQLMKQVMERQEMMQQKFLETIEKREQDRMVREEAWKRQEMARLHREHEIMAQERALSASRDAAFISFLQKITGQTFQGIPTMAPLAQSTTTINPVPATHETHEQQHRDNNNNSNNNSHNNNSQDAAGAGGIAVSAEQMELSFDPSSSRWPKPEVQALIRLRSGMEPRYQDAGPKGPLWEEISAGMSRLGYNRSAKRCKEKWENINKYFKKVKESNKKRPEDAKTCPYFHQLDQLYRKRILGNNNSNAIKEDQQMNHTVDTVDKEGDHVLAIMPPPGPSSDAKNNGATTANANRPAAGAVIAPTNGTAFYSSPENRTGADQHRPLKKPAEGLVMDVMDMDDDDEDDEDNDMQSGQQQQREQQSIVEDYDDDKIEADDSDNNNEHEPQHHNVTTSSTSSAHDHLPFAHFVHEGRTAASAPANSFMAMVHRLSATSDQPEFKTSKA